MYYLKIKFSLSTIDNSGLFNIDQQKTLELNYIDKLQTSKNKSCL